MPTSLGPAEIMVILVVALIVLGPNRLPEAGRQVGKALAEVRRWTRDVQGEIKSAIDPEPDPASTSPSASGSTAVAAPVAAEPEPPLVSLYPPPPDDDVPVREPTTTPSDETVSSRPPSGGPA